MEKFTKQKTMQNKTLEQNETIGEKTIFSLHRRMFFKLQHIRQT